MQSWKFVRGVVIMATVAIGCGLSAGGAHRVSAGEIAVTPNVGLVTGVAAPTVEIPNEMVIAAERTAGLCSNGICPLGGCKLDAAALSCTSALQTCHVSIGGTCVPPTNATTSTPAIDAPGGCAEGPSQQICNHQDPNNTGCAGDGVTNEEVYDGDAPNLDKVFTDNRWSSKCQSNWARTFENGNYGQTLDAGVDYDNGSDGDYQTYNGNYMWSNMLWGGSGSRPVCAYGSGTATASPGTGYTRCY